MSGFDASEFIRERCGGNDVPDNAEYCQAEIELVAEAAFRAGLLRGAAIARAQPNHYGGVASPISQSVFNEAKADIATAIEAEAGKEK